MPAAVTGSKTVLKDVSPQYTAAAMTALLATAPENMTVANVRRLHNALSKVPGGNDPTQLVGTLFP
jgi:hypothetical protein